ncbi:MAG: UrcA family protein [Acidobacteria bacterium]|jgi:UrcA family protein|nr:UrcA family protein [Acidobacteriota bacterium]
MYRPLIAAALAVTVFTAPALAASSTFNMDVGYSKAKLATPASAAEEYDHIRKQVADRCETELADVKYGKQIAVRACTERTLTNTVRAINNANLSEVHANR